MEVLETVTLLEGMVVKKKINLETSRKDDVNHMVNFFFKPRQFRHSVDVESYCAFNLKIRSCRIQTLRNMSLNQLGLFCFVCHIGDC